MWPAWSTKCMPGHAICAALDTASCAAVAAAMTRRSRSSGTRRNATLEPVNRAICAQPVAFSRSTVAISKTNGNLLIGLSFIYWDDSRNPSQPVATQPLFDSFARLITELSTGFRPRVGPAAVAFGPKKSLDTRASVRSGSAMEAA